MNLAPEPTPRKVKLRLFTEFLCVFLVFFAHGAWPTPDVNEPNYLGKALHFWNPDWAEGDFFLQTADAHTTFYWTLGWLALWLPLPALAWTGRVITWLLMAWGWLRLSQSVTARPWFAVLSAAALAMGVDRFSMAGEWLFGGVEGKGFAYALVFFALAEFVAGRWNLGWLLLGAASAFHVLVGGWTVAALALVWLGLGRRRPPFFWMLPGLAAGLLLALPGILPVLWMNRGTDPAVVDEANILYVYFRLWHHLNPVRIWLYTPLLVIRFGVLCVFWLFLWLRTQSEDSLRVPQGLAAASVFFALVGTAIAMAEYPDSATTAALLRFYWFRLSDMAVALAVALAAPRLIDVALLVDPWRGTRWLVVATTILAVHLGMMAQKRIDCMSSVLDQGTCNPAWLGVCEWVAESGQIAPNARFITPMKAQTFKWYTGRPEVANWKEMPQDARSLVDWIQRLKELFAKTPEAQEWYLSLSEHDPAKVKRLAEKYDADYVLTFIEPKLPFPIVFQNRDFVIYCMKPGRSP